MIALEKCRDILNNGKRKFNNEEIKEIREHLYFLAKLQIETENNNLKDNTYEECNNL